MNSWLSTNPVINYFIHFFNHFMARYGTHVLVILKIRAKTLDKPTNVVEAENRNILENRFYTRACISGYRIKASQRSFPSIGIKTSLTYLCNNKLIPKKGVPI